MKTTKLSGAALDWAVAKCEGHESRCSWILEQSGYAAWQGYERAWGNPLPSYSTDWAQGGPIIERENISVIRIEDENIPDERGYWQNKYKPAWAAVIKDKHSAEEQYGSQGDYWGASYHVDSDAVRGETPLIAAMRCYVASKLGDTVDIPAELGGDV